MKTNFTKTKSSGFVLLFTVLITAVVLLVALGVSSVSTKELILTSSAREGHLAFFSADTGLDCALHFDRTASSIIPGEISAPIDDADTGSVVNCFGPEDEAPVLNQGNIGQYSFKYDKDFPVVGKNCFTVEIYKTELEDGKTGTRIVSKGYNTCDEASPRRVERTLEATY